MRGLSESLRTTSSLSEDAILATLRAKKEELMKEVYVIMTATLGVPPKPDEPFTWDYYNKDGKHASWTGTPLEFYKSFAYDKYSVRSQNSFTITVQYIDQILLGQPADSFSLINDPRNDYGKLYTVDKLGNLWGERPVLCACPSLLHPSYTPMTHVYMHTSTDVNTEIEKLKQAVISQLKAGQPVFFGCDVGKFSDRSAGIMDQSLFAYEAAFDISFGMSKADRLRTTESSMTHAMVISAVHLDERGRPVRYKVENSWGEEAGEKGWFVMSDRWFEEFVYQIVIPKALAPKDLVKVFESGERTVLPPWDPMVSLSLAPG